jgi:hypothetical protein
MDRRHSAVIALVCAALAGSAAAATATAPPAAKAAPAKAPTTKRSAPATPKGVVEPGAVAALTRMGTYLRSLTAVQVTMDIERDDVDAYGQLLTFNGETVYKVKAPDGFNISVTRRGGTRNLVYDGKSVTVFDPATSYYARFDAAPTIRRTLDIAADKYGITVPLDELFHWDQDAMKVSALTSAHYVGEGKIAGQDAQQYAFRGPGVDWQIWIAKGDKPVPLRMVIVARDDPAKPQFEARLTWDTAPQFAADTFVFTPPANAKLIPIDTTGR